MGGGLIFFFVNFHPETWQNDSQVDVRIFFQMGWFNHQLVFLLLPLQKRWVANGDSMILYPFPEKKKRFECMKVSSCQPVHCLSWLIVNDP